MIDGLMELRARFILPSEKRMHPRLVAVNRLERCFVLGLGFITGCFGKGPKLLIFVADEEL